MIVVLRWLRLGFTLKRADDLAFSRPFELKDWTLVEDPKKIAELRRQELGAYLRNRRAELAPEEVGLIRQPRRRVSGLRRYEVADLASVSDTWYTWLEQGRNIKVSAEALDAIARALRLDEHARRHVRRLAAVPDIDPEPAMAILPDYGRILDKMIPYPACMTTVAFDLVQWNQAYVVVMGDPEKVPSRQRNALWSMFEPSRMSDRMVSWETEARGLLARFRYESGQFLDEPRFAEIIHELSQASAEFRAMWDHGQVRPFADPKLTIIHPEEGELNFVKFQMRSIDRARLVLTVHQPADEGTKKSLERMLDS